MRKTRRFFLVTLLIVAVGALVWLGLCSDSEPTYHGKPLTYWLDEIGDGNSRSKMEDVIAAINHTGTNAIPTLLRLLKARDSKFKLNLIQLAEKQHLIKVKFRTAGVRHLEAAFGFSCLGPKGKSALPALIKLYNENRLDSRSEPVTIVDIIGAMGPAAADAVPVLIQGATDTNFYVRLRAIDALGNIQAKPELTVPVLTSSLQDVDWLVRRSAATCLGYFGADAKSAVPELIKALSDPSVGKEAANALQKIDPEAAAKAGVK